MDEVHTHCKSRGADGLAFVIQAFHETALGGPGRNLGYGGIQNSVAVEFDTYYNHDALEPHENHVAVHTRGWRHPNDPSHAHALGHTSNVPDLANGKLSVR